MLKHKDSLNFNLLNILEVPFIITILLVLIGLIFLLLMIALFMRKEHCVSREIVIHAPKQEIFNFLKLIQNQYKFNKWAKADEERTETFKGTDGTIGYVYTWSGNKRVGEGEKEIKNITEGEKIETEIRFIKPMRISAEMIMETVSVTGNQTKVTFINKGILKYPLNIMIPMFEKNFAKDMDTSLATLKRIFEIQ